MDTAELIFDVKSFPFNISEEGLLEDEQHGFKFVKPVDQGVIFNLKSHLASSLKKDVLEGMPTCSIFTNAFDKKKYLWRGEFDNKGLRKQFEREFLSRMKNKYGYRNVFKNPLEVEGNSVYIKDVFNDARFIDSITRYKAWLTGMDLGVGNDVDRRVQLFRCMVIRSIYQVVKVTIDGFVSAPPLDRTEASILTPIMQNGKGIELLTKEDARAINRQFNNAVLADINGRTKAELSTNGSSGIYGIDFSNPEISHCVVTKIIESSVINKDHELAIDPELRLQALSPPGTPPNQRKAESGYDSNSPPKPKDSVAHSSSGDPGPSSKISHSQVSPPRRSRDGALKDSPRRGSKEVLVLPVDPLDVPGTSREFPPRSHLSYTAVSRGVSGPSKGGNLGAAAASGSIPGLSLWSQSEPSSSKGANKSGSAGTSAWPQNPYLL